MLGFWELLILMVVGGVIVFSYLGKNNQKKPLSSTKDEDIIELDEDSYEVFDDKDRE